MFQTKKVINILYFPLLCSIIIYGQRCDDKFMYKTRLGTLCTLDLSWLPLPISCGSVTDHHSWSGLIQRVRDTLYMYQVWPGHSSRCTRSEQTVQGTAQDVPGWSRTKLKMYQVWVRQSRAQFEMYQVQFRQSREHQPHCNVTFVTYRIKRGVILGHVDQNGQYRYHQMHPCEEIPNLVVPNWYLS